MVLGKYRALATVYATKIGCGVFLPAALAQVMKRQITLKFLDKFLN